jgi:uncharacterized membrane protein (UPF0127 family)
MLRKSLSGLISSALLVALAPIGTAQENQTSVTVRIAKTKGSISPFGTVSGQGSDVMVRLYREVPDGSKLLDKKRVVASRNGHYEARFDRPRRGECRVNVRVTGTDARDEEQFPCYIPDFPQGRATLTSATDSVSIDALIAATDPHRNYGLMYRPKMRSDLGMAFLYEGQADHGGFWMKNTLLPLSIAFIDDNDVVVRMFDMTPCKQDQCRVYDPKVPYSAALEVNQGAFEEWGISEGDRIEIDT